LTTCAPPQHRARCRQRYQSTRCRTTCFRALRLVSFPTGFSRAGPQAVASRGSKQATGARPPRCLADNRRLVWASPTGAIKSAVSQATIAAVEDREQSVSALRVDLLYNNPGYENMRGGLSIFSVCAPKIA
jgi:hypothetical protein